MRNICIFILLVVSISCQEAQTERPLSMPGAYKMTSMSIKSATIDTTISNPDQLKIYTPDFMMYVTINSPDSVSSFGFGSYTIDQDTLTENIIYQVSDSLIEENPGSFKLYIEKTDKGYQQLIAAQMEDSSGAKFDYTEWYDSVGTSTTSAIDGAWKMKNQYYISGQDTTVETVTQYKVYYAGNCAWGRSWKDSLNKIQTGIGYGKFTMISDNKVKESYESSTYWQVRNKEMDLDIEFIGKDGYIQTIYAPNGARSVEVYERMKK